jgi:hypothetical protein
VPTYGCPSRLAKTKALAPDSRRDISIAEARSVSRKIDFFLLTGEHKIPYPFAREYALNLFPFVGESKHSAKRGEFTIDRCRAYSGATSDHILLNAPFVYPVNPCARYGSEFSRRDSLDS